MSKSSEFTPFDLFQLAKEVAEHEAELKIKLAKAGIAESATSKTNDYRGESV